MNIVHIGSSNVLSLIPLQALLDSGHVVQAIVINDCGKIRDENFPVFNSSSPSLELLAFRHHIPLIRVRSSWLECIAQIQRISPDIIFVSCFSRRLPNELCSIARQACINLHPSLLPTYRGPDPIFWQFRDAAKFGISLHHVSAEWDAGSVLAQKRVAMPDGASYSAASILLADEGANLLLVLLDKLKGSPCVAKPQHEAGASYQSFPDSKDFIVATSWSAKRMYNFIRAIQERGIYCPCIIDGHTYLLTEALSYQLANTPKVDVRKQDITIPCQVGSIEANYLLK